MLLGPMEPSSITQQSPGSLGTEKKPIPPAKLVHATKLYSNYLLTVHTVSFDAESHPATPSPSSADFYPSPSGLSNEGLLSFSPVQEQPGTTTPTSSVGTRPAVAYNGAIVKTRTRRPLSPTAKAKAALIRFLGSCDACRAKSTGCPLDHHDIDALEMSRLGNFEPSMRARSGTPQRGDDADSAVETNGFDGHIARDEKRNRADSDLLGVGSGVDMYPAEMLLPGRSDLAIAQFCQDVASTRCMVQTSAADDIFIIGSWVSPAWSCACHFPMSCTMTFPSITQLQTHFREMHFRFHLLESPLRMGCLSCMRVSLSCAEGCGECSSTELQPVLCGRFLPLPMDDELMDTLP